ncbi:MAG: glycosyltransferase family 9 protein [Veillonellales bacterium]
MKINHASIKKILVINLAFIGDVLLTTPVTRALRENYPGADIDMLVVPVAEPIARLNPYIHQTLVYDKRGKHKKPSQLWQLIRQLRQQDYDLTVSTNFALRGSMVAWASGARYRAGYDAQHAKWFLTHVAASHRPVIRHEAENQLDVLKPLGITTGNTSLTLQINPLDRQKAEEKVKRTPEKSLVVLCPAGSYPRKSWTVEGYAALLQSLSSQADCCLIGGPKEQACLEQINHRAGNLAQVFGGTLTLGESSALISQADLLITVDTAPLHIAQAVDTPVLALFGPTDPKGWGPRGPRDIVLQAPAACAPCWGKGNCERHACMEQISSDQVVSAALNMLGKQ